MILTTILAITILYALGELTSVSNEIRLPFKLKRKDEP